MLGGLRRILEIPSRFSRKPKCLPDCFKIRVCRAGQLTSPDESVQEKLLFHDLSSATIQSILPLSSRKAPWKLPALITA